MANPTTNYGFVLPSPTDLVTDLPADFDVALQGVDTRLKALQPGTTLGDLAYSSATANTNTRLGIGSTGQVLTVAGGVPTWATAAGQAASASAQVNTQQSTTSGSFTDLATAGPAVTLTTGTKALVIVDCVSLNTTNQVGAFMGCEVTGASSVSASTNDSAQTFSGNEFATRTKAIRYTGLTAGSNTFTAKYKVEGNTGTFEKRNIFVMDLGS